MADPYAAEERRRDLEEQRKAEEARPKAEQAEKDRQEQLRRGGRGGAP
jgi:hypothetical protein